MRVLVIGSGAREHALVRSLCLDSGVTEVVAAPGNPGMVTPVGSRVPVRREPLEVLDAEAVTAVARSMSADLVVIGPEAPLVAGVADVLRDAGFAVFGPSKQAARLEGSKAFAKEIMSAAEIPTALSHACADLGQVASALDAFGPPYVVKDDGLAAGKGVVVTSSRPIALDHAASCLAGGRMVLIEQFLDGPEVSLFCVTDGENVVPLAPAQDFKRLLDSDLGPNTGGMGAYSPLPWAPSSLTDDVLSRVAMPTIREMARRGTPFSGLLYCGIALTSNGLRVIEFNVRFGDPETQVVLARLETPLGGVLAAAARGRLGEIEPLRWSDDAAVTVVLAAAGYPGTARRGDEICGLAQAEDVVGAHVLHAGTAGAEGDRIVASGGRVLSVVGRGQDLVSARHVAYRALGQISLAGGHYRGDIAAATSG